ncbi:uncharacterized protein LOC113683429 [Pocillopora damicornis]|uniref:uncharacterized protein LOC113683429 n=1 Tax=Pocillopora damicornis TaxID=46731 RepID=UPI000F554252|nr:uncharacterized protein LOC113683429 [Pocillopora damicornis]
MPDSCVSKEVSYSLSANLQMNFSCTEACGSKMKTTALCVFALFLSSMLVEGVTVNYKCLPSGNCKRAKGRTPKKFRDKEEAGNLEMMKMDIRRRLEEPKREQQYRREICLQARELRCGMEQKK